MSITRYTNKALRARLLRGEIPHWLLKLKRGSYVIQVHLSTPDWVDRQELYALRDKARLKTKRTGHLHVLAHIVPVTHPKVCGLTVPWNLEVKPWRVNLAEGNKFTDVEHEQHAFVFDKQPTLF